MNNIHVPYNNLQVSESNKVYDKYSNEIIKKMNELKSNPNVDSKRKDDINESGTSKKLSTTCTNYKSRYSRGQYFVQHHFSPFTLPHFQMLCVV